jgi:ubiquinone biosynthesis protein
LLNHFRRSYRQWDNILQSIPRDLDEALRQIHDGKFRIKLEHRHLDGVVNRLVLGIVTASLFLGSSLLWSLRAPPTVQGVSIFGAAGYLVSLILGWLLYRAILGSGTINPKD